MTFQRDRGSIKVLAVSFWPFKKARDNTVQYKNKTLQLFPGTDRTSYAGSRVEVQERLDGRILVKCGEEVLTPQQAPPLAAHLRS